MMKRFDRDKWKGLSWAFVVIAALPVSVWLAHPKTLAAASPSDLAKRVLAEREDEIIAPMARRYEAMSLNMEGPDRSTDATVRWIEIEESLRQDGVELAQSKAIVRAAQARLKDAWPCFAERGYLRGQPVWLVVASTRSGGHIYIDSAPPADDARLNNIELPCTRARVAVINAQAPFEALN